MSESRIKRGVIEIVFYVFLHIFAIALGTFAGFALTGFEASFFENLIQLSTYLGTQTLYLPFFIIGLGLVIFPIVNMLFIQKEEYPPTQKGISGLTRSFSVSYLFNPEQSFFGYISKKIGNLEYYNWATNIMRVLFVATLIFLLFGIFQSFFPQLSIAGVPPKLQQITTESDIVFGSVLPTFAEGSILLFFLFIFLGVNAILVYALHTRGILNRDGAILTYFMLAIFIIAPIIALGWMQYHTIVYGNSAVAQFATFLFALISAELTILTGIFFYFYLFHLINNLVLKLLEIKAQELVAIYLSGAFFIILIIYILFEIYQRRKLRSYITD